MTGHGSARAGAWDTAGDAAAPRSPLARFATGLWNATRALAAVTVLIVALLAVLAGVWSVLEETGGDVAVGAGLAATVVAVAIIQWFETLARAGRAKNPWTFEREVSGAAVAFAIDDGASTGIEMFARGNYDVLVEGQLPLRARGHAAQREAHASYARAVRSGGAYDIGAAPIPFTAPVTQVCPAQWVGTAPHLAEFAELETGSADFGAHWRAFSEEWEAGSRLLIPEVISFFVSDAPEVAVTWVPGMVVVAAKRGSVDPAELGSTASELARLARRRESLGAGLPARVRTLRGGRPRSRWGRVAARLTSVLVSAVLVVAATAILRLVPPDANGQAVGGHLETAAFLVTFAWLPLIAMVVPSVLTWATVTRHETQWAVGALLDGPR